MRIAIVLLALITLSAGDAAPFRSVTGFTATDPRLGINIGGSLYWSSHYPLKNLVKCASAWLTFHDGKKVADGLQLDPDGYPLALPDGKPLMLWMLCRNTGFPAGRYVASWTGGSTFTADGDVTVVETRPGRLVLAAKDPSRPITDIQLILTRLDGLADLRLVHERFAQDDLSDPWLPEFLAAWRPATIARFMDLRRTNRIQVARWEDEPRVTKVTYGMGDATWPWPLIIDYCNRTRTDAWINLPHLADAAYARRLGEEMRRTLDPGLAVVAEYSNEFWHPGFAVGKWSAGQVAHSDAKDKHQARVHFCMARARLVLDAFCDGFGRDQRARITTYIGTSAVEYFLKPTLASPDVGWFDAIGTAPYFAGKAPELVKKGEVAPTVDAVLDWSERDMEATVASIARLKQTCDERGLRLFIYEAGPHLTPKGDGPLGVAGSGETTMVELMTAASLHPRMGDLTRRYYAGILALGIPAVHFTNVHPYGESCAMGTLATTFMDPMSSSKYQAVASFWKGPRP